MKEKIFEILDNLKINYKNYEHNPVHSCSEAKCVDIPGQRVKSLLIRNKKWTNFYMVVLPDNLERLDTNIVRNYFEDSKMSFVEAEKMHELIWVYPGSVSPYALINNAEKNIKVVFCSTLKEKNIWLHPLQNDNTIVSSVQDVLKFLDFMGFEAVFLDF